MTIVPSVFECLSRVNAALNNFDSYEENYQAIMQIPIVSKLKTQIDELLVKYEILSKENNELRKMLYDDMKEDLQNILDNVVFQRVLLF